MKSLLLRGSALLLLVFIVHFAGCFHKAKNIESNLPPAELIRSNFSAADFVLSIKPDSIKIVKTIYADNGEPGYVIVEVAGKVKDCYKGDAVVGELVRYRFMAEFEKNLLENWRKKALLLVFLKKDEKSGGLRAIEFGQFELTPGLLKKVVNFQKD